MKTSHASNHHPSSPLSIPGFLSRPNLADDGLHPHDLISDHPEEPQLVRLRGDLQPALLTGRQQLLPGLHHLVLAAGDGFGLLAGIHRPQLCRALLQLTHLAERERRVKGGTEVGKSIK